MAWLHPLVAAALGAAFATDMKLSSDFGGLWPPSLTVITAIGRTYFLILALCELPVDVVYSIWITVDSLGTTLLGVLLLGEGLTAVKLVSVGLIAIGVVGLK